METHRHPRKLDSVWYGILEVMLQWTLEGMREKDFPSFKKLMSLEMGAESGFTTSRQKGRWRKWG